LLYIVETHTGFAILSQTERIISYAVVGLCLATAGLYFTVFCRGFLDGMAAKEEEEDTAL
jgi:sulfite exporter TauE/SafE